MTFASGFGVLVTGNIINERLAQQLRQFDKAPTEAKTELGTQQERAAKAEAGAVSLRMELLTYRRRLNRTEPAREPKDTDYASVHSRHTRGPRENEASTAAD